MSRWQDLYRRLPEWAQCAGVWAYGWHLKRLRTGGVYTKALSEFAARDAMSAEQWYEWQSEALKRLLRHAVTHVPFYRELHRAGRYPVEDVRSPDDLPALPSIDKVDVHERPEAFLADTARVRTLMAERTSGTTGLPLTMWISRETLQRWHAAADRRMCDWHRLDKNARTATIGQRVVVPPERTRPPFWRYNPAGRQLYLSIYHFTPRNLDAYLDALREYRVVNAYGFASALDMLAGHAIETGRHDVALRIAFSNAEPLYAHQRERIERAFRCRCVDTYAATEKTFAAYEFRGTLYVSPDVGVFEVARGDGASAMPDESGEVIGTGLLNPDYVLIRYRQGDRAALAPSDTAGPGPWQMPIVRGVRGRSEDVLYTAAGEPVGWASSVLSPLMRIREAQIAQVASDLVEARVVPGVGYADSCEGDALRAGLAERFGPETRVRVCLVASIPRLPSGKFRAVVRECAIPTAPREHSLLVE